MLVHGNVPRALLVQTELGETTVTVPPVVQGGQEIGLGSRNLRRRAKARPTGRRLNWDGKPDDCAPLCSPRRATRPNGEWGYYSDVVLAAICWAASAQRHCYPTGRCTSVVVLPTFSQLLFVNKLLSLSENSSLSRSPRTHPLHGTRRFMVLSLQPSHNRV